MPGKSKSTCPFIDAGLEECFVTGTTSAKIEEAIAYCGGNYEECRTYRTRIASAGKQGTLGGGEAGRVLVVDDDADFLASLRIALCRAGYSVSDANNGVDGLTRILLAQMKGEPFDLLITDVEIPEVSTLALIRQVKGHGIPVPVMAITGGCDNELASYLKYLGCREVIEKPFTPKELIRKIGRVLPPAGNGAS